MKRLQVGDECYVRIRGVIYRFYWCSWVANCLMLDRANSRLVYPCPIIKQLAK
jgi:hypothetical protein